MKTIRTSKTLPHVWLFTLVAVLFFIIVVSGVEANFVSQDGQPASYDKAMPGEILVRFRPGSEVLTSKRGSFQLRLLSGRGLNVTVEDIPKATELLPGLKLIKVAPSQTSEVLATLNLRSDVLYSEPNFIWRKETTTPNDTLYNGQWGLRQIEADKAWDITQGDSNVVVGVIDGGVDISHADLQENIWTNPNEIPNNGVDDDANGLIDDVNGWDFHHGDNSVFDNEVSEDHGTHVAGIIGARGNNSIGVSGVCWRVSLLPIKALGPNGGSISAIVSAYAYAKSLRQRGINLRVLNNSYGGSSRSMAAEEAIAELSQAGILFVTSAGNGGRDNFRFPHYPSNYQLPNVIAVASLGESGNLAGATNFGERRVQLAAPGADILSTIRGDLYAKADGTSMAAPHVAGAAALIISAVPNISMTKLKGVLIYSNTRPTFSEIIGILNVRKAILAAQENDTTPPAPPTNLEVTLPRFGGRIFQLSWVASGDDGNVGTSSALEVTFIKPNGERIVVVAANLETTPPGTPQTILNLPHTIGSPTGTYEVRAYDNVGNSGAATIPFSMPVSPSTDPYITSLSSNAPLSTGGERLVLDGDDEYANRTLSFDVLPGGNFNHATISTNGAIYFGLNAPRNIFGFNDDIPSSVEYLNGQAMLAVLWDDLIIDTQRRPDAGVFLVQPNSDTFIFRWQANRLENNEPVNFEAELRRNGTFVCRYGSGNQNIRPVVGLSFGEPTAYLAQSHTSEYWQNGPSFSLQNAQTVTFAMRSLPPTNIFDLARSNTKVFENSGSVTIHVMRPPLAPVGLPDLGIYSVSYTTSSGSATPGVDYAETSGVLTFSAGDGSKSFTVPLLNDSVVEGVKTFNISLSDPTNNSVLGTTTTATVDILDDDVAATNQVTFAQSSMSVNESTNSVSITVNRTGDLSQPAFVDYATSDNFNGNNCTQSSNSASSRCDYLTTLGRLLFVPGQSSKTISVSIINDVIQENAETLTLTLQSAVGTTLVSPASLTLTILDNDTAGASNPVDDATFFVRQHYLDFLSREPDAGGLNFWTNEILSCGSNAGCVEVKRINVSAAFFLSIEFQETGYLVYRMYKAAYGNGVNLFVPVRLNEFLRDTQRISEGVQVGVGDWKTKLESNKQEFAREFVERPEFVQAYPGSMLGSHIVDKMRSNLSSAISDTERSGMIALLGVSPGDTDKRASVVRAMADDSDLRQAEFNRAFVLMEYMGYLRRNPNDLPDSNFNGYSFWLSKLNAFNGNFIDAEMVKAFISSIEYRNRFAP